MASIDLTTADPILKSLYKKWKVEDMTYQNKPTLGWLQKDEGFRGRNMPIPIQFGHPQGRSGTFSKAQSNATAAKVTDFLLTRRRDYGVATVDGETAEATEGDNAAFVNALALQVDGALKSVSDSLASAIFRNGTGSIAQVGSISTNTLTLKQVADIVNFEVGMTLQANATDGGTPRTGTEVVAKVNRSAGTLQSTSATWATVITAIAANDYLLVEGDNNAKVTGFDGWFPATAPTTGDNWYGVDRSVDSRLYGQSYDASLGDSMEEAVINSQSQAAREGAMIDKFACNPIRFRDLVKGAQTKAVYERTKVPAQNDKGEIARISFRGVVVEGDEGPITVMSDPRCQADVGWGLTSSTVGLASIGPAPKLLQKDGLRILRQATADGYEVRVGMYGNVWCDAPGWNIRVKFA